MMGPMKAIEFRRHAEREKDADALSPEGRSHAEDVGRSLSTDFAVVFVSPARRAAETVAWFLRGSGQQLPQHTVVRGLLSEEEDRWRAPARLPDRAVSMPSQPRPPILWNGSPTA